MAHKKPTDVATHFIAPLAAHFPLKPGDEREQAVVLELRKDLQWYPEAVLEKMVDHLKRTRKYRSFPALADVLAAGKAVGNVPGKRFDNPQEELTHLRRTEEAKGLYYVACDSPNWPIAVKAWEKAKGGRKFSLRFKSELRHSEGWHFPRDWIKDPVDNWDEIRIKLIDGDWIDTRADDRAKNAKPPLTAERRKEIAEAVQAAMALTTGEERADEAIANNPLLDHPRD